MLKQLKRKIGVPILQVVAKWHRRRMKTPIIAVTGTNGKTTTKELLNAVLSKKYKTVCNQGNFNNHIGVPLTLRRLKKDTEIAVVEMGANHPGEIDFLCKIAQPNFGLITNIGKAHLEGYVPTNNRSQVIETGKNRIVMDAYNANPVSMKAAITNFRKICGDKPLLILGDMLELGSASEEEHQSVVKLIEELGFETAFLVGGCMGKAAQGSPYNTFANVEELCSYLKENPVEGYDILIKGSHGVSLEKALEVITY